MRMIFCAILLAVICAPALSQQPPATSPAPSLVPVQLTEANADRALQSGIAAYNAKNYRFANDYFLIALEMDQKLGLTQKVATTNEWLKKNDLGYAEVLIEEAKQQEQEKAFDLALLRLQRAAEIFAQYEMKDRIDELKPMGERLVGLATKRGEAIQYMQNGNAAYLAKDYAAAKDNFTKARAIFVELDMKDGIEDADQYLADIAEESKPQSSGPGVFGLAIFILSLLFAMNRLNNY